MSAPNQPVGRENNLSPGPVQGQGQAPGAVPKSQSMGFVPRQNSSGQRGVPDTHPYRGFLNGQQQQQQQQQQAQQGMSRSSTMPVDRQGQSSPPVQNQPARTSTGSPLQQQHNSPPRGGKGNPLSEFDRVVELIAAQPQKTYVASPPELEMILARTSAGGQPK